MSRMNVHVVHLRLTHAEWSHVAAIAQLRRLTVEELLREQLRLSSRGTDAFSRESSHLRLVKPGMDPEPHPAS